MAIRNDLLVRFGALVRRHRVEQDRTQLEVATAVGVTQPSYSAYENGLALPTVPVLLALLRELSIPLPELMELLPQDDEPNGDEQAA